MKLLAFCLRPNRVDAVLCARLFPRRKLSGLQTDCPCWCIADCSYCGVNLRGALTPKETD